ncbi:aminopeptidase [Elysia marginata]|uniref:Aminopeptidase n=1 Tax=Elysia marginata TaxID=1093978 RepID=A0AAV4HTB5_9GAST|nr:aminopeptidase [Elysia marginata]
MPSDRNELLVPMPSESTLRWRHPQTVRSSETILNKKEVYEPTKRQRFRQIVCTRGWTIGILMVAGAVVLAVAVIAAFARPGMPNCSKPGPSSDAADPTATSLAVTSGDAGGDTEEQTFTATNGEEFPWREVRLPKTLIPQSYDIFLHPNISRSEFSGHVKMILRVMEETDVVLFHVQQLNVSKVEVMLDGSGDAASNRFDQPVAIKRELEYPTNQLYYVQLGEQLSAGSFLEVKVEFSGQLLKDDMDGFYLSSYTVNGEERLMASTQFESTYARQAFPCMDEPALKATFKLSIVREKRHITLFNMRLLKSSSYDSSPHLMLDEYTPSVKMSTYLVAFVVCDFKNISATTSSGTLVRVFAPEDKIYMGQYALDAAVAVLQNYSSFFGLPYELPKADLVAIPNFQAGAMENWGLVTYRDTAILYDPAISSDDSKKWVAIVVAHELAHQWFGNLVTMNWWDDLWLNEGFASFVEYIGLDVVDKSFDGGSALIRMLESVIGRSSFKEGLKNYLTEHSYSNAVTRDLWRAWQQVSPVKEISVPDMMDTWTLQMGYPVVTVTWDDQFLYLSQERFLLTEGAKVLPEEEQYKSPYGYKWIIPFTYSTSSQPDRTELKFLKDTSMKVSLPGGNSLQWLKANTDLKGFYRVNYDVSGWQKLSNQLKKDHTVFSVSDRIGLMDDAFSLARAGQLNYSVVLEMVQYMSTETDYHVWDTVQPHLGFLAQRLALEEEYDLVRQLVLSVVRPGLDRLGWGNDGDLNMRQLRASLIAASIKYEDQASVDKILEIFEKWKKNETLAMNNELRGIVYNTGVKFGNKLDWDLVYDRYFSSKVASDRNSLLVSLTSSRDVRVLQILLEFSLDTSKIKSQDAATVLLGVARNPNGLLQAWRFLRQHWDLLLKRYSDTSSIIPHMVKIVSNFNSQFDLDEVKAFFQNKNMGSAQRPLEQSLELLESHVAWVKAHQSTIKAWLHTNIH